MTVSKCPVLFDSSVALAVMLGQPQRNRAAEHWDGASRRVGSVLFEAECRTVLRRAGLGGSGGEAREAALDSWLTGIRLYRFDRKVLDALAAEPRLGRCRTLDAVHLATALVLRARWGRPMAVCTFDGDMAGVAADLGFEVLGGA